MDTPQNNAAADADNNADYSNADTFKRVRNSDIGSLRVSSGRKIPKTKRHFNTRNKSISFISPFVSPKEKQTITDAENRYSPKIDQYRKIDGAQVGAGFQPLLGANALRGGLESSRLQTLLPNIKKGGGGALVLDETQSELAYPF